MFERMAEERPRASLIDFFGRKFSYGEVADLARRVATGLAGLCIRPGDRVGLYLPNVPYYVVAYYGALRLGAVVVNLSPLGSQKEISRQVNDSGVRLIFTLDTVALLSQAMQLIDAGALERLVVGSVARVLPLRRGLLYRLVHGGNRAAVPVHDRVMKFEALVANDGTVPKLGVDPERDVALLQYTGGTTDEPKAAMLTHQAL
ncbi:MAG TPA: AMP-binding protein, partial [Sphingomonas sp.]|nr:AMP-binding protein [Sphingomonas sp.]